MKDTRLKFIALLILVSYILVACGETLPTVTDVKQNGNSSAQVEFAGKVEAINGDQWTVNGQTFQVSARTQVGGNFKVGDDVHVSATVKADGSVEADQVRAPEPTAAPTSTPDQLQSQIPTETPALAGTPTPVPAQPQSQNQSQTQAGAPATEFVGTVEAINGNQWTIGGQNFTVTNATAFRNTINIGDLARVHVVFNINGAFTIIEIGLAPTGSTTGWNGNGMSNGNAAGNSNDNSNGDKGNHNGDDGKDNHNDGSDDHDD